MLYTMGRLENRMPLSIRSNDGKLACSALCLDILDFALLRVGAVVPSAARAAAAAADDFNEPERDVECLCTPPVLDMEALRGAGLAPGGSGFFLGGAICPGVY
jgi:hypothetical protein